MGRAIVRSPAVFLMDEPLSNLDAKLRVETRANIAQLQARLGTTTLYVTHDQVEAMTMGHRVAVLKEGGILQQVDTPRNLYERPQNAFVAGFIGSPAMNIRAASLEQGGARLGNIVVPLRREVMNAASSAGLQQILLGIRPESFHASEGSRAGAMQSDARGLKLDVDLVEELGADAYVYGRLANDTADTKEYVVRFDGRVPPRIGETISVDIVPDEVHAFVPESGERLG
jgi:multiple sugar transport system ATP-binding protein